MWSLIDLFGIFAVWPGAYCPKCKRRVKTTQVGKSWGGMWRAKCKNCWALLPIVTSATIRMGASGILSKRFQEKHKGSVPDSVKERHSTGKKNWRKFANFGGRIGFKGDGTIKR